LEYCDVRFPSTARAHTGIDHLTGSIEVGKRAEIAVSMACGFP
jgi:hypothetical protein